MQECMPVSEQESLQAHMIKAKVSTSRVRLLQPFPHHCDTLEVAACLQGVPWPTFWTHLPPYLLGAGIEAISDSLHH